MSDSPANRLVLFRKTEGLSQEAFAIAMGVSRATVSHIESGTRTPSKDFLEAISNTYGINSDWLLNGHGEMQRAIGPGFKGRTVRIEPPKYDQAGFGDFRFDDKHYVVVRRMDLSVSAGRGVEPVEGGEDGTIALPVHWFQRARVNSDLTVMVKVKGDSMAPGIADGAFVLIHLIEKEVLKAGIYAFTRNGEAFVKRLIPSDVDSDGRPKTIMVIADNPAFPPQAISNSSLNELRVVGRVRAVFSMLD